MGFLSSIGSALEKAARVSTIALTHPIATIKAIVGPTTLASVAEKHFAEPPKKQLTEIILNTALAVTSVYGVAAIAGKGIVASVAKLIPSTLKGKVIAAIAAPVVLGAVVQEPEKALQVVTELPSALTNVGGNIAELVADPSLQHAKELITENPVIVGTIAAGLAILGAKAILPAIVGAKQIEAVQEQTEAIREAGGKQATIVTGETIAPTSPVTPATERVVTTAAKTPGARKRRSSKAPEQHISQRVNVIVANKASSTGIRQSKKYINRELLIH